MKTRQIPRATIQRMAMYIQVLEALEREGTEVISSEHLARTCAVNPSQIRKDLAYFGEFGVRGVGYHVHDLTSSIKQALGVDRIWKTAVVGIGNLGRALLNHRPFKNHGFHIIAAFDCDPFKIGETVNDLEVICSRRIAEKTTQLGIELGIITTPPERAQRATDYLVAAGIKGIINYAPARVKVPDDVVVEYVDFFHYLYTVAFKLSLDNA